LDNHQVNFLFNLIFSKEFAITILGMIESSYMTGEVLRLDGGIRFPHL